MEVYYTEALCALARRVRERLNRTAPVGLQEVYMYMCHKNILFSFGPLLTARLSDHRGPSGGLAEALGPWTNVGGRPVDLCRDSAVSGDVEQQCSL